MKHFLAAKIAENSLKELSDHVGDELTWRAYQDLCSLETQKFEDAGQGVLESRYFNSNISLLTFILPSLILILKSARWL